jgi:hypothetical protein
MRTKKHSVLHILAHHTAIFALGILISLAIVIIGSFIAPRLPIQLSIVTIRGGAMGGLCLIDVMLYDNLGNGYPGVAVHVPYEGQAPLYSPSDEFL